MNKRVGMYICIKVLMCNQASKYQLQYCSDIINYFDAHEQSKLVSVAFEKCSCKFQLVTTFNLSIRTCQMRHCIMLMLCTHVLYTSVGPQIFEYEHSQLCKTMNLHLSSTVYVCTVQYESLMREFAQNCL